VYDCDFDICCVCCEYNQVKTGFKADDGDHKSACFDTEEDCQIANRRRKIEIPQPEPPEAKSPTEAENRIARTANKWLITMNKLEEDQLANRADDNSPTSPSPELSDDEQSDQDGAQQHQRARAPGSIEWKNDPSNRGHTSMQDWPRPNAEVFQNAELEEMDMREPQEAKDAINPCECECHLPGPRTRCTCRCCQRHPQKRPHRLHEDVETRIRKENLVRKHMACADCCKASAKDKSFFTADPNERIEVALGPYKFKSNVILQRIRYRLLDPQPPDPATRKWLNPATPAENKRNAKLKPKLRPYQGRNAPEHEKWATGWTFLNRPANIDTYAREIPIEYPKRLYATASQAIKAWKTEHDEGKIRKDPNPLRGVPYHERPDRTADIVRKRRIHPIRVMDSIPTWVSLQNRTLANPGGGWSKLRPQTPAEEKGSKTEKSHAPRNSHKGAKPPQRRTTNRFDQN